MKIGSGIKEKENFYQDENRYRTGIEFSEIEGGNRKMIVNYIEKKTSEYREKGFFLPSNVSKT